MWRAHRPTGRLRFFEPLPFAGVPANRGRIEVVYFQVTSMPKKCMNTSRFGLFFGFC